MEPARSIIKALGGVKATADVVGLHRTRVSNWMRSRKAGGTGGVVPHWHVGKILAHAEAEGIEGITVASFAPVVKQPEPETTGPTAAEPTRAVS